MIKNSIFGKIFIIIALFLAPINTITSTAKESNNRSVEYQPKPGRRRTQSRKPGGYRGEFCNFNSESLTLIIPTNHIPLTTSSHPTFWWYISTNYPIQFTIYEPGQPLPLHTQELLLETPSIVALKLPRDKPPLEIGKQYRWTVTVICNEKRPSENIYAKAWIERVEYDQIKRLESKCLNNFAKAGIWHEALVCNSFNDKFWSLIEQIDLIQIAKEKPKVIYLPED